MIWGGIDIIRAGAATLNVLEALHGGCFAVGWDVIAMARLLAMPGASGTLALSTIEANDTSQPVGFLLGREAGGEAEIISTGVLPLWRGRGIGSALVSEFILRSQERGAAAIFLEVAVNNQAALSVYKRLGFSTVGLRKGYYASDPAQGGAPADALVMRRNLLTS